MNPLADITTAAMLEELRLRRSRAQAELSAIDEAFAAIDGPVLAESIARLVDHLLSFTKPSLHRI